MTEPTREPVALLLQRARPVPARSLVAVQHRVRRIRRRRRRMAAATAVCAVTGIVMLIQLLSPGLSDGPSPAGTPTGVPTARTTVAGPTATRAPGRSPDGLLYPEDLGAGGWMVGFHDASPGDLQLGCSGFAQAFGVGKAQTLEGTSSVGGSWTVQETVVALDARTAALVLERLAGVARDRCPRLRGRDVVLAADSQVLLAAATITPDGSIGEATGYALVGRTWITVRTALRDPGGDPTARPLPGQVDGLSRLFATAVERATGTRPRMPAPNAAARAAAARYVTPAPMRTPVHQPVQTPTTATPTATEGGDARTPPPVPPPTGAAATAPTGFLTLDDLGPGGAWSVGIRPGDRTSGLSTVIHLPAGTATVGTTARDVRGKGGSQLYRGWLAAPATEASGNTWLLRETVVHLDPARATDDAGAFARLLVDSGPFTDAAHGTLSFYWSDATGFLATRPVPGAAKDSIGVSSAWILRDGVLTQLDVLPGGPDGGRVLTPSDAQWVIRMLDLAARRAAG